MPAVCCFRHKRFWLNRSQPQCFHYFGDFSCAALMAMVFQLARNPSSTVTSTMFLEDDSYQGSQFSILLLENCWCRISPCIERSAIHFHEFTDLRQRCCVFESDCFDGRIDICYSLRPKIANAFFNTSRSRSTRRSSFSSSRTRASSELATGPL